MRKQERGKLEEKGEKGKKSLEPELKLNIYQCDEKRKE